MGASSSALSDSSARDSQARHEQLRGQNKCKAVRRLYSSEELTCAMLSRSVLSPTVMSYSLLCNRLIAVAVSFSVLERDIQRICDCRFPTQPLREPDDEKGYQKYDYM